MGWATLWAIFSKTHLVTLFATLQSEGKLEADVF
jgi:hypothetical protein